MEILELMTVTSFVMILLLIFIIVAIYKYRNNKKQTQLETKHKLIRGFLIEDNCVVLHGSDEHIDTIYDEDFEFSDLVYIQYYADYKLMKLLAYIKDIGFVLEDLNETSKPKFYFDHEIYIGIPRETYVEGYLNVEKNVFVITKNLANE